MDIPQCRDIKELQAETLLKLVKEHKERCDGMCGLMMLPMKTIYHELVDRDLTEEEFKCFL